MLDDDESSDSDHGPEPSVTSVSERLLCDNALPADHEDHDDAVAPSRPTSEEARGGGRVRDRGNEMWAQFVNDEGY